MNTPELTEDEGQDLERLFDAYRKAQTGTPMLTVHMNDGGVILGTKIGGLLRNVAIAPELPYKEKSVILDLFGDAAEALSALKQLVLWRRQA